MNFTLLCAPPACPCRSSRSTPAVRPGAVRRWIDGSAKPPAEVVAWLQRRAGDPPPRQKPASGKGATRLCDANDRSARASLPAPTNACRRGEVVSEEIPPRLLSYQQLTETIFPALAMTMAGVIDALVQTGAVRREAIAELLLAQRVDHPDPLVKQMAETTIRNTALSLHLSD